MSANPCRFSVAAWPIALVGLGLATFAVVALSGPGRIDVVDGQTRFEVGQSLVEHGDSILRDERIWWSRFPGRDGQPYSYYRLPQSLAAAGAILAADATGPESEGRRHFFFVLCGAVAGGLSSVIYALWFRHTGCRRGAALLWGAGGVFCTPTWYYATSTFDEYLGTAVLIAALVAAALSRERFRLAGAVMTGLLLGAAYNCKQPLAAFGVLALVLHDDPRRPGRERFLHGALIVMGLLAGIAFEQAYDKYKFPFDKDTAHAELIKLYGPNFAAHQFEAIAVLMVSFGAGAMWYFPPLLLTLAGLRACGQIERRVAVAFLIASAPFLGFFVSLSYFKGDPCWGPRYLTPWFGALWLFAAAGAVRFRMALVGLLLVLGVGTQILALSVDPHRLYVERDLSSGFGRSHPGLYFDPELSHLANRPREMIDLARAHDPAEEFTPAPAPTFAFPLLDPPFLEKRGGDVVRRYRVLNSFRPWWCSMTFLPPEDRPVNLGKTAAALLGILAAGLFLSGFAVSHFEGPS